MDETTAPTTAVQAALDALADARVSASLVMVALVALVAFLAWRLVLRRHRLASAPARPSMPRSFMHRLQSSPAVRALSARFSGRLSAAADAARTARGRTGLRIRWGRTALFLTALVALLVFLVAGVAAAFGAGTLSLAGWSLLFAAAGLAGLRALAVRDCTRRARPAAVVAPERPAAPAVEERQAPPADPERDRRVLETVLAFETEAPRPAAAPAAPRVEPVVVTASSAAPAADRVVTIPAVPRPTYLDAPEMARPLPTPLETPAPGGSDTRLQDAARTADDQISAAAEQDIAALDLDNVLARRRAG
ncbi:Uncharacterised protein [Micrococcus luteus NCTC 2665]|uniref:Uncharacterized protein n=2 Tax=Micrococcus luteus TaxID=1270 RepID=C5CBY8_MICLC|nr:hypothetical protein [Micrococcus luteus]ACS31129.1 hypothetical protein Mlut_16410 [Micrococcus luteus NCTC 2665]AJO56204.1 hypothetical protein BF96_08315 [Micrococcus luteus]QCY45024.1 hypothetical protein ERB44_07775 [Micrococcus luteus]SQG47556.1 Uncharacterised protein [Micrococcus luteus NCTC 2665]